VRLAIDELEDIVEDEPLAVAVLAELEDLRVGQSARLLVDLVGGYIPVSDPAVITKGGKSLGPDIPRAGQSPG